MIQITDYFKEAIKTNGKLLNARVSDEIVTYSKEDIVSIDYSYKADFFKSVMRICDIELLGEHDLKDRIFNVEFGVKQNPDDEYENISYGNFIVKEQEYVKDTKSTKLECYDLMLKAMVPYDLDLEYPITIKEYLIKICNRLGWALNSSTFLNEDELILEEKYDNQYTFRDVLDEIAQVSLSIIAFKNDNKLHVIYPTETNEVIDYNLKKLTMSDKFGKVNSFVLGRSPQEDNLYRNNPDSIEENGLTEIRIDNNQLMDKDRDSFIQQMFDFIDGFEYYPFDYESFGVCYLDIGDKFTILNPLDNQTYDVIMMHNNIQITQGLNEVASALIPGATVTDYAKADTTDRRINKTNLQVDKQNQIIEGVVVTIGEAKEDITNLKMTSSQISQSVTNISTKIEKVLEDVEVIEIGLEYLKNKDNGTISTWFLSGAPTLSNMPANQWTSHEERLKHEGDIYYDKDSENSYRFLFIENNWTWELIEDDALKEVLRVANEALSTAQTKITTFYQDDTPEGALNGDIWILAESGLQFIMVSDEWVVLDDNRMLAIFDQIEELSDEQNSNREELNNIQEEFNAFRELTETRFEQTSDAFNFRFINEILPLIDEAIEIASEKSNKIEQFIRFVDGNIILGATNSVFSLEITPDKISFMNGSSEMAYFSNNTLYVANVIAASELRSNSWSLVEETNGSFSIKKEG
jgi:hypothetical protein